MTEEPNVIVDEIKFFFTHQGKGYNAYTYVLDKEEIDIYGCIITEEQDNKEIDHFYFDSCGGTEEVSDIAHAVLDILFDNKGMIRGF